MTNATQLVLIRVRGNWALIFDWATGKAKVVSRLAWYYGQLDA